MNGYRFIKPPQIKRHYYHSPSFSLSTGKVHIYKTAHDPRFEEGYKVRRLT